jgi:hypothetical protein
MRSFEDVKLEMSPFKHIRIKAQSFLYGCQYPIINQKNSNSNGKSLFYSGFEPKTLGFQVSIATN